MISVIMNSFNEAEYKFHRAVNSILNQNNVKVQLLLSTVKNDNSIQWSKSYDIEVIINETPGIYEQINATLPHIKGNYVAYSSSNDVMLSDKFSLEKNKLKEANKKVCYSAFYSTDENLEIIKTLKFKDYDYLTHLRCNYVSDCALVEYSLFRKYTPFVLKYGNHAFYDLWLRIYEGEGDVFCYNDIPTWKYVISQSSQHIKREKDELKKKINEENRAFMLSFHKNSN